MGRLMVHDFYCTRCGSKGMTVPRVKGKLREPGHLKKLFCLKCKEEVNHVEVIDNGKYSYEDFLMEFNNKNFNEEGLRIKTYNQLLSDLEKEGAFEC